MTLTDEGPDSRNEISLFISLGPTSPDPFCPLSLRAVLGSEMLLLYGGPKGTRGSYSDRMSRTGLPRRILLVTIPWDTSNEARSLV